MSIVNIDVSSENAFEEDSFEPVPKGIYIFSVGNLPGAANLEDKKLFKVQTSKAGKPTIPVQIRIEAAEDGSDTPYKGRLVFDNCALSSEFGQKRLIHLALSCGAMSEEEIKASGGVDLERFTSDMRGKAEISVKMEKPYNDPDGEPEPRNNVRRYLWA